MQIPELAAKLQSVGFSEKQAKVYVAALFLGPSAVQKIGEQAGVNRATTYVILSELAQMGLISESTQGKKTVYVAEPPEAIGRLLDSQRKAIDSRKDELKDLMPNLSEISRVTSTDEAPVVKFYKGKEGIATISAGLRRAAKHGSQIYGFSNYDEIVKVFPEVLKSSPQSRVKKKISSKLFYYHAEEIPSDKKILRETKRLSEPVIADINLYEDKAALLTYNEDHTNLSGIVIESKEIVGALRQIFDIAWKNYKK